MPYCDQHIGIFDFRNGKVTRWREYLSPLILLQALGPKHE
jgi:hypothetical protein